MEPNRIWHEPEVVIYSGLITSGLCCSGNAYDLANRRWYQINVDSAAYDEEWMADIVEKHISTYYHTRKTPTPFNVINATRDGSGSLEFGTQPNHAIARPIREKLYYDSRGENAIPVISFGGLVEKIYLGRAVDRCRWKDHDCAFKRIEFDCDIKAIDREIKSRETLPAIPDLQSQAKLEDANKIMERRFNVIPILAIVVVEQDVNNEVMGILMPFSGPSLESLSVPGPQSTASKFNFLTLKITRIQLRDLARGVREFALVGVVHGDINERNTLFQLQDATAAVEGDLGQNRLVLVDFGSVAPGYKNDAFALGELFLWCKERSSWGVEDLRRVGDAAQVLKEDRDFDRALSVLDDEEDR